MPDDGTPKSTPPAESTPDAESEDWRAIADRAMKEKDPKQVTVLVEQLNRALDKSRHNNRPKPHDSAPPQPPAETSKNKG